MRSNRAYFSLERTNNSHDTRARLNGSGLAYDTVGLGADPIRGTRPDHPNFSPNLRSEIRAHVHQAYRLFAIDPDATVSANEHAHMRRFAIDGRHTVRCYLHGSPAFRSHGPVDFDARSGQSLEFIAQSARKVDRTGFI